MAEQEELIRVLKTGMFPLDCIGIGKHQVRTRRVSDNLEPLKNSTTKFGQLVAKAISLIENEMRKSVLHADIVKACTDFYKLGSAKAVSEELALSYRLILNAINYPAVQLRYKIPSKMATKLQADIRATDALRWENGDKALDLAKRMEDEMPRDLQKAVREVGRSDPSKPLDQILDEAEKLKPNPIKITSDRKDKCRLNRFAAEEVECGAAANLILDGLESRGY